MRGYELEWSHEKPLEAHRHSWEPHETFLWRFGGALPRVEGLIGKMAAQRMRVDGYAGLTLDRSKELLELMSNWSG